MAEEKHQALTPKQELFCQEYIKCGNQSEAYRIAYPTSLKWKDNVVKVKASQLMNNDNIMITIKELQNKLEEKHNISKDKIINELMWVIDNAKFQEKIDFNGINKAVDTLNKMFGYYAPEKKELSGELNVNDITSRLIGKS